MIYNNQKIAMYVLLYCSLLSVGGCDSRPDHIWVGMDWTTAKRKLCLAEWTDMGVDVPKENDEGMIHSYQSPCGAVLFFCTAYNHKIEYISEMTPSDCKVPKNVFIITEIKYR